MLRRVETEHVSVLTANGFHTPVVLVVEDEFFGD